MRYLVGNRLPEFSKHESKLLADSYDFIGINYYTTVCVADNPSVQPESKRSYSTDPNVIYSSEETSIFKLFKLRKSIRKKKYSEY